MTISYCLVTLNWCPLQSRVPPWVLHWGDLPAVVVLHAAPRRHPRGQGEAHPTWVQHPWHLHFKLLATSENLYGEVNVLPLIAISPRQALLDRRSVLSKLRRHARLTTAQPLLTGAWKNMPKVPVACQSRQDCRECIPVKYLCISPASSGFYLLYSPYHQSCSCKAFANGSWSSCVWTMTGTKKTHQKSLW